MQISAIFAMSDNRVIGKKNALPWHLPADLRYFKTITMGKSLLMGRKTFQSMGKVLPGRRNIIISHDPHFTVSGGEVVHSIEAALQQVSLDDEVMLIGGATLFQQLLPHVSRLYLTMIHCTCDGDTFFPEIHWKEWKEISRQKNPADQENPFSYSFVVLDRSA